MLAAFEGFCRQSQTLSTNASALKKQGKIVEFVELPDGDHSLSRQANRETYAIALLAFLQQHLREPMPHLAKGEPAV